MTDSSPPLDPRPIDPVTRAPLPQVAQPGYYPGFRTLSQQRFWDAKTRAVVIDRVENIPPMTYLRPDQVRTLHAACDRIVPQDDRESDHRIPIVAQIDRRLAENSGDGYRYEGMPPDREAYELGLEAIARIAHETHGRPFHELTLPDQERLLQTLHDGAPPGAHDIWKRLPVERFWTMLVTDCIDAYYAHPWAWDEIGFGGPAYPRAYMRLERGEPEPWEVYERRYAWDPPEWSVSGAYAPVGGVAEQPAPPGQGGTH